MNTLIDYGPYWLTCILLLIGLYGMLLKPNLLRKMMGMTIFQNAVILFYVGAGTRKGAVLPVVEATEQVIAINPLPHVLMLTAIVVSVASTGVGLALLLSIYRQHKTLDEPTILERVHLES